MKCSVELPFGIKSYEDGNLLSMTPLINTSGYKSVIKWFDLNGWEPMDFQLEVWEKYLEAQSGLIHAPTGCGKTLAAFLGPVIKWLSKEEEHTFQSNESEDLKILWITPLRALAADTEEALKDAVQKLNLPWTVEKRTGDTSQKIRAAQKIRFPTVLVTTPESLSIFISRVDTQAKLLDLDCIVVDEWHELMGSKRGTLTELAIARIKAWRPSLQIWGLSATIGNLEEAAQTLLGTKDEPVIVRGKLNKAIEFEGLIPEHIDLFPWSGHLGINMLPEMTTEIENANSALIFTNTRSQTEVWYRTLLEWRPDWAGLMAIHHGSIDRKTRTWVENALRDGKLKCVVCTSSLDLGVDFTPVDLVIQMGSPKGVARLLQRAGRSGHRPGEVSRALIVPTHAFELAEAAAARYAKDQNWIESRIPIEKPYDVLAQHLVTCALGEGFEPEAMYDEIRSSYSYRNLDRKEWEWVLDFAAHGGKSLKAYDDFQRLELYKGRYMVANQELAKRHRISIGTITGDAELVVKMVRGKKIGTIEERFVSQLSSGESFIFAGRCLEVVRIKATTVEVRPSKKPKGRIPRWLGGSMPLSSLLAFAVRHLLDQAANGIYEEPEMKAIRPVLELQEEWSRIPRNGEFLVEQIESREGFHIYAYPFEGRFVHEGLAALWGYRISKTIPISIQLSVNDYGIELLSTDPIPFEDLLLSGDLLSEENLEQDIIESLNEGQMASRQFREVARIAGLVFSGYPGAGKSINKLTASSGLFFEVFKSHDPDNLLLKQAFREVLDLKMEKSRLLESLDRIRSSELRMTFPQEHTPLSFPILADRARDNVSSVPFADRIRKMVERLERKAGR